MPGSKNETPEQRRQRLEKKNFRARQKRAFVRVLELGLRIQTKDGTEVTHPSQLTQEDIDRIKETPVESRREHEDEGDRPVSDSKVKVEGGTVSEKFRKMVEKHHLHIKRAREKKRQEKAEFVEAEAILRAVEEKGGAPSNLGPEKLERMRQLVENYRRKKEGNARRQRQYLKKMTDAEKMLVTGHGATWDPDLEPEELNELNQRVRTLREKRESNAERQRNRLKKFKEAEVELKELEAKETHSPSDQKKLEELKQLVEKYSRMKKNNAEKQRERQRELAEAENLLNTFGGETELQLEELEELRQQVRMFQEEKEKNAAKERERRNKQKEAEALLELIERNPNPGVAQPFQIKLEDKLKAAEVGQDSVRLSPTDLERIRKLAEKFRNRKAKKAEWRRQYHKNLPEEVLQKKREQRQFYTLCRRVNMTEEDKKKERLNDYFYRHAKQASMSKEEWDAFRRKTNAQIYAHYARQTPEQRFKRLQKLRAYHKEKYMRRALEAEGVPEPEIQERIKAAVEEIMAEPIPPPEQLAKIKPKPKQRYGIPITGDTPEEKRFRKLLSFRISQAKKHLRKKLEKEGVPEPEIEKRMGELVEKMRAEPMPPPDQISEYRPRYMKIMGVAMRRRNQLTNSKETETTTTPPVESAPQVEGHHAIEYHSSGSTKVTAQFSSVSKTTVPVPGPSCSGLQFQSEQSQPEGPCGSPIVSNQLEDDFQDFGNDEDDDLNDRAGSSDLEESVDEPPGSSLSTPRPASPEEPRLPAPPPPSKDLTCPHCPSKFPQNEENVLRSHILSSHRDKCWKCPKCSERTATPKEFQEHFQIHKEQPKPKPKRKPKSKSKLKQERTSKRPPGKRPGSKMDFICMKCPFTKRRGAQPHQFCSLHRLTKHVKQTHPEHFWPCPNCNLLKYSEKSLEFHRKLCGQNA